MTTLSRDAAWPRGKLAQLLQGPQIWARISNHPNLFWVASQTTLDTQIREETFWRLPQPEILRYITSTLNAAEQPSHPANRFYHPVTNTDKNNMVQWIALVTGTYPEANRYLELFDEGTRPALSNPDRWHESLQRAVALAHARSFRPSTPGLTFDD